MSKGSSNDGFAPGEPLFDFKAHGHHYVCQLRTIGSYGTEAQFFSDGELLHAQTLASRALALDWAREARKVLEAE